MTMPCKPAAVTPVVFRELPEHETIWSMTSGIKGEIYVGICCEMTGGVSAYLARLNPDSGKTDYLLEVATALGVPAENGQATHAKVHFCLMQDDDGLIYAATHCTGAPLNDFIWRPWNCWTHPQKHFSGSGILIYDPYKDNVLFSDIFLPREGSRCMALASKRKKIYGISYPRDHFFIYDIAKKELKDAGRIGSINPECMFIDAQENAYTTDDYGNILKYDADREEIVELGVQLPHAPFRDGFHNVFYDIAPCPDGESVMGVTWTFGDRLFRYDYKKNKIYDYGNAYGKEEEEWFHIINTHTAGLIFGRDGLCYYCSNLIDNGKSTPHLIRVNVETGQKEDLGAILYQGRPTDHFSRAANDANGNLYFAETGACPTKLFKYTPENKSKLHKNIRRYWG